MHVYPNYYKKNFIIIYKKISPHKYEQIFCLVNIRMINLSFYELRLIAQIRNISDYENKSKEDLIKALSEPKPKTSKPETKPKPDTKPKQQTLKPEPETPKIRVKTNKRKLRKLRKDFDELRHNFFKKEIDRYRKKFYVAKNKKYLPESETEEIRKKLIEV